MPPLNSCQACCNEGTNGVYSPEYFQVRLFSNLQQPAASGILPVGPGASVCATLKLEHTTGPNTSALLFFARLQKLRVALEDQALRSGHQRSADCIQFRATDREDSGVTKLCT